jgi:hypothetical protein
MQDEAHSGSDFDEIIAKSPVGATTSSTCQSEVVSQERRFPKLDNGRRCE